MLKILFLYLFTILVLSGYGANDSIIKTNHKISIGFVLNPVDFSIWDFPHALSFESQQDSRDDPPKDHTKQLEALPLLGLNIRYILTQYLNTEIGVYHTQEHVNAIIIRDYIDDSSQIIKYTGFYSCKYLSIPISFGLRLPDNSKKRSLTNIKATFNFDFIFYDNSYNGDSRLYHLNGINTEPYLKLGKKEHTFSNSFNRITPALYIGRERFNKKGTFSFTYGTMFTFPAIYQNNAALIYYKNYKISIAVIGCNYHF